MAMSWLWDGWLAPVTNPLACLELPEDADNEASPESMLKGLESALRQRVQHGWVGHKQSIVRGHGLDFADLREYAPGDDIRKIDWNVFARTLSPHIKEYLEEKQLTVWVFVDLTPSMFFGSHKTKARLAIEVAGLLGLLTEYGRNKLGVFVMDAEGSWMLPPKAGSEQVHLAMQRLLGAEQHMASVVQSVPEHYFSEHLSELARVAGKQTSVFVFSDFLTRSTQWEMVLGNLSGNTNIYTALMTDPAEEALPANIGLIECFDPETGHVVFIDTSDSELCALYQQKFSQRLTELSQRLSRFSRPMTVSTTMAPVDVLVDLLATGGRVHA